MPCYSPLKGYKDISTGGLTFNKTGTAQTLEVACGQCLGCRIDHRIMWATRIVHESHMHASNSWVTLTYRDPSECTTEQYKNGHYIPSDYSLRPDDVQKFIRALRKANPRNPIRYFYCGEYGDENQRPHYHLCIFGHAFKDQYLWKDSEGLYTYTSASLDKLWKFGFSTVAELNYQTAAYTAGYALKKITGKRAHDHYLRCDEYGVAYWLKPEYIRMSTGRKKPCGLGASFYEKYSTDIFPSDTTPIPGHGTIQQVPRYYTSILESQDPKTLELVKQLRDTFIKNHREDFTPERIADKYHIARKLQNQLQRNL